eukprot:CFRG5681T1
MLRSVMFLVTGVLTVVHAENILVKAGMQNQNSISQAIVDAKPNSVVTLLEGDYYQSEMILLNKAVMIQGAGTKTRIHVNSDELPVLLYSTIFNSLLADFSIVDTKYGTVCSPVDTLPSSHQMTIFDPPSSKLTEDSLKITGEIGPWVNMMGFTDIAVGSCVYGGGSQFLGHPFFELVTNTCMVNFGISIIRSAFEQCEGEIIPEGNGTISNYMSEIRLNSQTIQNVVPTKTTLLGKLDAEFSDNGVAGSAVSEDSRVRAVLHSVDLGEINENTSHVEISLTLPKAFHVPTGSFGDISAEFRQDNLLQTSQWQRMNECESFSGDNNTHCRQRIGFEVTACDVSALYSISSLPINCKVDGQGMCTDEGYTANIKFAIDASELCAAGEENTLSLDVPITSKIMRMRDVEFDSPVAPGEVMTLGSKAYWSIEMDTGSTGLIVESAEIVSIDRTVDVRDCSGFTYLGSKVGAITQRFLPLVGTNLARLQIVLPVDQSLACDDGSTSLDGANITLSFTYMVSYHDQANVLRRSAQYNQLGRTSRDSGTLSAQVVSSVRRTQEHQAIYTPKANIKGDDITMLSTDKADLVALCAGIFAGCLCLGIIGAGAVYSFKKMGRKQIVLKSLQYEDMYGVSSNADHYRKNGSFSNLVSNEGDNNFSGLAEVVPTRPSFFSSCGSEVDQQYASQI